MKKIVLILAVFMMPFAFSSCGDDDDNIIEQFTGSVHMTVGGQDINLPVAAFTKQGGKVILTSTNLNHSIAMYVEANAAGTYTLGAAQTVLGLATNLGGITEILGGGGNYMLYSPSQDIQSNAKIVLVGSVTFSKWESNKIAGSFTGTAVSKDVINGLSVTDIVALFTGGGGSITQISGTFEAVGK
ncbi:MAG: hypothetical protein LBO06_06545 [Bacteroidales bacterium]|jgi:hypothetical protein|nr:hypothetical protein [Bacteroidales bacterium]